jgi:hypothetical protein
VRGEDQASVPKAGNQIGQRVVIQWSLFTNEGNAQRRRVKVDAKNCGKLDLGWRRIGDRPMRLRLTETSHQLFQSKSGKGGPTYRGMAEAEIS